MEESERRGVYMVELIEEEDRTIPLFYFILCVMLNSTLRTMIKETKKRKF